jgi:hypothetical protein
MQKDVTAPPRARRELGESRFFSRVQPRRSFPSVPYALAATGTILPTATPSTPGITLGPAAGATRQVGSSTQVVLSSAPTGSSRGAATAQPTSIVTSVLAVATSRTELRAALAARRFNPATPYRADNWLRLLGAAGLTSKYPDIPNSMLCGFDAGIRAITSTFAPPNSPTIDMFPVEFEAIIAKEYAKGRHFGPFSQAEVEELLGPFQSAPLSLVPKPGKETKRMVQNHSFPSLPLGDTHSINSTIDSDMFPCTWGTFATICLLVSRLPPGSQAAIRDVAEAHRTIPITDAQWPGLVVRLPGKDAFNIDTCNCFGLSSASGNHGKVGDAGCDLFRASGLGPLSKWSDDHMFIRIRREHIAGYNELRRQWSSDIARNGGRIHAGGRYWYRGATMPDDHPEEFDEDAFFPIVDHSQASARSPEDAEYSHCMADIDGLSGVLGIPWESSKDIPFCSKVPFTGLTWCFNSYTVSLPNAKKTKYLEAISSWESRPTQTLEDVQSLYGKLLHSCLVVPMGRAYLTRLETMLGIFHDNPFKLRTPPRGTEDDLRWWRRLLSRPEVSRPIPTPRPIFDPEAFSDASSGVGVAIVIGGRWRAWRLLPGWKRDSRDIGWAEAVGFELLVRYITSEICPGAHVKLFGDNTGVVEGWWSGRSRNSQINSIFRRVHAICAAALCTIHTRYIPSRLNPADKPSRGVYPPLALLLPPVDIPADLEPFICDFDDPITAAEASAPRSNPPARSPGRSAHTTPSYGAPFVLEHKAALWRGA